MNSPAPNEFDRASWMPALDNAGERLWLIEKLIALWLGVVLLVDPSLVRLHSTAVMRFTAIPDGGALAIEALRLVCAASAALVLFGRIRLLAGWTLSLGFLTLSGVSSAIAGQVWNYNLHLFWFLTLSLAVGHARSDEKPNEARRVALWLMQISVALFYLQSGLSKLLASGPQWFLSGRTISHYAAYLGTDIGRLLGQSPALCTAITAATGIVEFALPIALLLRSTQRIAVIVAWLFHLGVALVFGIGFWQLTLLYVAVFFSRPALALFRLTRIRPHPGSREALS